MSDLDLIYSAKPQTVSPSEEKKQEEQKTPRPAIKKESSRSSTKASKPENKKEDNIVSNITILQLNDKEIDGLRDPTNDVQTFRVTAKDKDWIKDTSYLLSKEIRRGSVSQTDILRLSFILFEKLLETNRAEIIKIIERIK